MVQNKGGETLKWLPHPCLLGAKRGQKCYVTLAISGIPNQRGQNLKWLPQPYLPGGPKEDGNDKSPLHSRESPTLSAGS